MDGKIRTYPFPRIAGQFRPTHMLKSSDGSLWIGTVRGLLHMHKGMIDRFSIADGLSGDLITGIFEDREGSVWVSTATGLDRFCEFAVSTISTRQGLSIAAVSVLEATPDGSIWIATADGFGSLAKRACDRVRKGACRANTGELLSKGLSTRGNSSRE